MTTKITQLKGVGGVFFNEKGEILIYKRTNGSKIHLNTRSIPCGTVEEGETPEECLKREMKEELGVDVIIKDFISKKKFTYNDTNQELTTYGFICEVIEGNPQIMEPHKMKYLQFIDPKNIPQDFFPELKHIINRIKNI